MSERIQDSYSHSRKNSIGITAMLLVSVMITFASPVSAIGPNQNDLNSGGDLPDNTSVAITTYQFTSSYSGSGELDYNDDADWLRVSVGSNQGLSAELSFNATTTMANGTTVFNDFDLGIYDSSIAYIDDSVSSNPEQVTTNNSASGASSHGGTVYILIDRFDGVGDWTLTIWLWNVGTQPPPPGSGDPLEVNDDVTTATQVGSLPYSYANLDIHTTTDQDVFEILLNAGTTYYFDIYFSDVLGDIDMSLYDSSTTFTTCSYSSLASSSSTSDNESFSLNPITTGIHYFCVYGYSSAINSYSVSIATTPGGGGGGGTTSPTILTTITSGTSGQAELGNLVVNDSYDINANLQEYVIGVANVTEYNLTATHTATAVTHIESYTWTPVDAESVYLLNVELYNSGNYVSSSLDWVYVERLQNDVTSSTSGELIATNLTIGTSYSIEWQTNDTSTSTILSDGWVNFTATAANYTQSVNWAGPSTTNVHQFSAMMYEGTTEYGFHEIQFIPDLPSIEISAYTHDANSSTNTIDTSGTDMISGDSYQYSIELQDANGTVLEDTGMLTATATIPGMPLPTWTYSTPSSTGLYCINAELYTASSTFLGDDYTCFNLFYDEDNDGVSDEDDLCWGTPIGTLVDLDGCADSQKDSDGDGYTDDIDQFPFESSQWQDSDGDGFGDNPNGNLSDAFPTDSSQWEDADGDGHGDNPWGTDGDLFPGDNTQWYDVDGDGWGDNQNGNYPDRFPTDSSQWSDADGDGYGDNASGNNPDDFVNDPTQWRDSDGDGYGDNASGNNPDQFPNEQSQHADSDGDGFGDNPNGVNGDDFPNDPTQHEDSDGDGFGDNQQGNNPDAFPNEATQWQDIDGDGYGDNPAGNNPDQFPNEQSQHIDSDGDGNGDNPNGVNGDQCLGTPSGESVDEFGCSLSQMDADDDGVSDSEDQCDDTPTGEVPDTIGCSSSQLDSDGDGIMNQWDECENTALNAEVNLKGCADYQRDGDNDMIPDSRDNCLFTPIGDQVDGTGCSEDERDTDEDGIFDSSDSCDNTPSDQIADGDGCADSQLDGDDDSVMNNLDLCRNTQSNADVDENGCSDSQKDEDRDGYSDAVDSCLGTKVDAVVDENGCSRAQSDSDGDLVSDMDDLCPETPKMQDANADGCAITQLDTDKDGTKNHLDNCPETASEEIADENGCSLSQLDSDGDGVSDFDDKYPEDPEISSDSDGDGVADIYDAYPEDSLKSVINPEESSMIDGTTIAFVALAGVIGVLGFMVWSKPEIDSGFTEEQTSVDLATEMAYADQIAEEQYVETNDYTSNEPAQWVDENGVNWSKGADGVIHRYDEMAGAWIAGE